MSAKRVSFLQSPLADPEKRKSLMVNFIIAAQRLDRIQAVTGVLRAYDGRYCVWGTNGPFDVRDVGNRIGLTMHEVVDALPDFTPVKRGRASVTPEDDSTE